MACFRPLFGYPTGNLTINGRTDYRILHSVRDADFLSRHREECTQIPCGKCIGCRLAYARQWADRCMLELQYHDSAYFLTLTYNEDHVPTRTFMDGETGVEQPVLSLQRRDLQLFWKRLRKAKPDDSIRYFACGEYGPDTFRPHYHAILFGLHLDDLYLKQQNTDGMCYYGSPTVQAAWSARPFGNYSPILDSLGDIMLTDVTWDTCNYVARYIVKKQLGPDGRDFYSRYNLEPPFTAMSTHPGIGRWYYDDHPDIHVYDTISISTPSGGRQIRPPRYFDKLYDLECPEEMDEIKQRRRRFAEEAEKFKLAQTSLSVFELQELQERRFEQKMSQHSFDL